jgi:hypothetical protein
VIFYWLIAHVGPSKTMLVSYIAPGFAVVYGATLLDEDITVGTILGLALILLGSWLGAEGRLPWRAPTGDEPPPAEVDPAAGAVAEIGRQPEAAIRRSSGAAR